VKSLIRNTILHKQNDSGLNAKTVNDIMHAIVNTSVTWLLHRLG
jgi:hypothetical protein